MELERLKLGHLAKQSLLKPNLIASSTKLASTLVRYYEFLAINKSHILNEFFQEHKVLNSKAFKDFWKISKQYLKKTSTRKKLFPLLMRQQHHQLWIKNSVHKVTRGLPKKSIYLIKALYIIKNVLPFIILHEPFMLLTQNEWWMKLNSEWQAYMKYLWINRVNTCKNLMEFKAIL